MKTKNLLTNENKYNLLTGRVPLLLNRYLGQKFKKEGINLSREQWSILAVLYHTDGVSQQILADATNRDKPSVTRLVDNLEKLGLVERRNHEVDRRLNLIFLTNKGKELEQPILKVVNDVIHETTKGLTEAQILAVRDAFQVIYENIK
ncbi:MAG TPA: MarR family transcriptional regulator [Flavobacterium sp.]|nr:MarR family transcriptional regulator [Flavobacterium sp.]